MIDEWNGLAYLLANLIEKYASQINLDDLPTFHDNDDINNNCQTDELPVDKNNCI